jgi:hypothetical protein
MTTFSLKFGPKNGGFTPTGVVNNPIYYNGAKAYAIKNKFSNILNFFISIIRLRTSV